MTPVVHAWVTLRMLVPLLRKGTPRRSMSGLSSILQIELEVQRAQLSVNRPRAVGNLNLALWNVILWVAA